MLDLRQLLRVRAAYAGGFDADGGGLVFVSDLGGVPQVWGTRGGQWPELLVAPPDRAQTLQVGPRPGQLVVGADVGGNEHTQLLYVPEPGATWQALTDRPEHIHHAGGFSPDGAWLSLDDNTRTGRWFDVRVRSLVDGQVRTVLEADSTNHAGPFSPDGRWLLVTRSYSNSREELWLVDLASAPGEAPRLLTAADGEEAVYTWPAWRPDGRSIVCLSNVGRECAAPAQLDVGSGKLTYLVEPDVEVDECRLDPSG
jgi:Tol biopolymer transport system component